MITIKINAKKAIGFLLMLAVLTASWFFVWGNTIVLLGLVAILIQTFSNLHFVGWISVVAYSITYWIASILDQPTYPGVPNNLYLLWYLGYGFVFAVALIVDLFWTKRKAT